MCRFSRIVVRSTESTTCHDVELLLAVCMLSYACHRIAVCLRVYRCGVVVGMLRSGLLRGLVRGNWDLARDGLRACRRLPTDQLLHACIIVNHPSSLFWRCDSNWAACGVSGRIPGHLPNIVLALLLLDQKPIEAFLLVRLPNLPALTSSS